MVCSDEFRGKITLWWLGHLGTEAFRAASFLIRMPMV